MFEFFLCPLISLLASFLGIYCYMFINADPPEEEIRARSEAIAEKVDNYIKRNLDPFSSKLEEEICKRDEMANEFKRLEKEYNELKRINQLIVDRIKQYKIKENDYLEDAAKIENIIRSLKAENRKMRFSAQCLKLICDKNLISKEDYIAIKNAAKIQLAS